MRILVPVILTSLTSLTAAAAAQQPPPPPPPAAAKADKMICKRSAEIGSMIPTRKECHTPSEWTRLQQDARVAVQEMENRRVGSTPQSQ